MIEIDQARNKIVAAEKDADEKVKSAVKDLLSNLQPEDFPTMISDNGIYRVFYFSYCPGELLIAAPQGLFHANLRNWGLVREESQVINSSLVEASPRLYRKYSPRIVTEIERIVEAKRAMAATEKT